MDKVSFGARGMAIFPITGSTDGLPTYGASVVWGGLREITGSPTSESTQYYADDTVWFTLAGTVGYELDLTHYTIPLEVKKTAFGLIQDMANARVQDATAPGRVGVVFETQTIDDTGIQDQELHIFYDVTFNTPEISSKTKEDSTEPQEFKATAKCSGVPFEGFDNTIAYVVLRKSEVTETVYNNAKISMYIPEVI